MTHHKQKEFNERAAASMRFDPKKEKYYRDRILNPAVEKSEAENWAAATIAQLSAQVEALGQMVISGFYEEGLPKFRQGTPVHELEQEVSAEEVTSYVAMLEDYRERYGRLDEVMTPFVRATLPKKPGPEYAQEIASSLGVPLEQVQASIDEMYATEEVYLNALYQVNIRRFKEADAPGVIHLSIKRVDKKPIRDWRHFQQIKNELVGPEYEGLELYPAESRLVDTANQYHIWVMDEPGRKIPIGFPSRLVYNGEGLAMGKQRPMKEG